jgi:hypothetical protein
MVARIYSIFQPTKLNERMFIALLDNLVAWGGVLKTLRKE